MTHLKQLGSESIHITTEVITEFSNPGMSYSVGKDSSAMIVSSTIDTHKNLKSIENQYTQVEIELNHYIRKHYPEWNCKGIF